MATSPSGQNPQKLKTLPENADSSMNIRQREDVGSSVRPEPQARNRPHDSEAPNAAGAVAISAFAGSTRIALERLA
jgi:hypothetical protein